MREEQLGAHVSAWLTVQGWDVYPEVTLGGPRADIVARRASVLFVVECKTTLGLDVIAQADYWRGWAHYVAVAVPGARGSRSRDYAKALCRRDGIGLIEAWGEPEPSRWSCKVKQLVEPRLCRVRDHLRTHRMLAEALTEEHKRYRPGNASAEYHTPYRATCEALLKVVRESPGISLREAVDVIRHHYASDQSARSALAHWIDAGKVPGVRKVRDGRVPRLYPEDAA